MTRMKIATKAVIRDDSGKATEVIITFTDGRTVQLKLPALTDSIQMELMAHGAVQKLGDSYANAKGNLDFAYAEASGVAESLMRDEWNRRGEGGGGDLPQAIVNITGQSLDTVVSTLATMDKETKDGLKKRKDVKAEMMQIKANRLSATRTDDDTVLDELF